MVGIYKITSPKFRIYVGKSTNIHKRWSSYKKLQNCKSQIRLHRSFIKYGVDSHLFELITECNESELDHLEKFYIKKYDCFDTRHGLNLKGGGQGGACANETKAKIGIANKGKPSWMKGKTHSSEIREKLSKSHIGHTPANKGKIGLYKHSDEVKSKIAKASTGRYPTQETIVKLKAWKRKSGWEHSKEAKDKMSKSGKGRKSWRKGKIGIASAETRAKMSESHKRRQSLKSRQPIISYSFGHLN